MRYLFRTLTFSTGVFKKTFGKKKFLMAKKKMAKKAKKTKKTKKAKKAKRR